MSSCVFIARTGALSSFAWPLNVTSNACANISTPMLNASTVEAGAAIRFVATFVDAYGKKELHVEITAANED